MFKGTKLWRRCEGEFLWEKKGFLGGTNGPNRCSQCLGRRPSHKTIGGKLGCGMSVEAAGIKVWESQGWRQRRFRNVLIGKSGIPKHIPWHCSLEFLGDFSALGPFSIFHSDSANKTPLMFRIYGEPGDSPGQNEGKTRRKRRAQKRSDLGTLGCERREIILKNVGFGAITGAPEWIPTGYSWLFSCLSSCKAGIDLPPVTSKPQPGPWMALLH